MGHRMWMRLGLGYLILVSAQIGVWAAVAPQSFYDSFPGFGRMWISVDGPYNEHLVRDVGGLNLALTAVLIYAAVIMSRVLVTAVCIATLAWGMPHLIYHSLNTGPLGGVDVVASLGGLVFFVVVPALLLFNVTRLSPRPTSPG